MHKAKTYSRFKEDKDNVIGEYHHWEPKIPKAATEEGRNYETPRKQYDGISKFLFINNYCEYKWIEFSNKKV